MTEKPWSERETNLQPPHCWSKVLHEVTGTIARRGTALTVEEYGGMMFILGAVKSEMRDAAHRLFLQSGRGTPEGCDESLDRARLDYGPNR